MHSTREYVPCIDTWILSIHLKICTSREGTWPPPLALNRRPQASSDPSAVRARASAAAAAAAAPVDLSSAWLAMRSRADSRSHSAAERGTAGARSGDGCRRGASLPSAAWTLIRVRV